MVVFHPVFSFIKYSIQWKSERVKWKTWLMHCVHHAFEFNLLPKQWLVGLFSLFQPTRLQYGIHSAAGIFQREVEKLLRMDDILISGKNDNEHFQNLKSVLDIAKKCGLRLKKKKCVFVASEVTYLRISN